MKIARYIKGKKRYTTIYYTGLHISLSELINISDELDNKNIKRENIVLLLDSRQADYLIYITEITRAEKRERGNKNNLYGSFLGMDIVFLGEETDCTKDFLKVMSKYQVESYFRERAEESKGKKEENMAYLSIFLMIIVLALIFKI